MYLQCKGKLASVNVTLENFHIMYGELQCPIRYFHIKNKISLGHGVYNDHSSKDDQ